MSVASGGGSAYLEGNGVTLTNPTGSNIQGAGFIGDNAPVAIVNNGEILANVSGQTLVVNAGDGGVTNNNILEAENGGTLMLHNTITNTNGHIDATGGGTVNVNATIVGGLLFAGNGGVMQTDSAATLNGVEIASNSVYLAGAGTTTTLIGTINNEGSLHVAAGTAGAALVSLGGDVTLSGGGSVVLSNGGGNSAQIDGAASGYQLTNANNTIEGAGQIGDNSAFAVLNGPGGKIAANVSGDTLSFNEGGGAFTNQGTVTVARGAKMVVYGDSNGFNQTQGASRLPLTQVDGELDTPNGLNLGAGALAGTGTTGGVLNPGDPGSPGVLTVDGDYNQGSGGAFDELIKGSAVGTG
jgi:hypothetical protein